MHDQAPAQNGVVKTAALLLIVLALSSTFAAEPRLKPIDEAGYAKVMAAERGKIVLVDFWATWCDPCREELPQLAVLEAKLRKRGFVLITVSADEPEQDAAAYALLLKDGVRLPGYRKQAVSDQNFINFIDPDWSGALPAMFLYDRQGKKVKSMIGETGMDEIEQAVGKLL